MNQLSIDISFNHNDAVKFHSDISCNLNDIKTRNFHHFRFLQIIGNNNNLFDDITLDVPLKIKLNGKEYNEILKVNSNCKVKVYKDASDNDISKNNLYLGFDERAYFKDGNLWDKLKDFKNKIPDELLENNKNLFELDLESDDLPEDVKKWKKNKYTFKPFLKYDLGDGNFFYMWLNNFGIEIRSEFKFSYNCTLYIGKEIEKLTDFNLVDTKIYINMIKRMKVDASEIIRNKNK